MSRDAIIKEAKRLQEDLLWIQTAHYQMATFWRFMHWSLGISTVVLTAVAGGAALKAAAPTLVIWCIGLSTVTSALQTFLNPQKLAKDAYMAGVQSSTLMSRVRRFHELDLLPSDIPGSARQQLETLAEEKGALLGNTPHTGGIAYWLARRSVPKNQHVHLVDT